MGLNKKKKNRLTLLIILLLVGIGFAALTANLKINGTVNVSRTAWDVHFENVNITPGSVTATTAPVSDDATTTEMTYTINFTKPGDYFEFTTDIVNEGTIDAMVDVVSNNAYQNASSTTPITLPTYLTSTVTYSDGIAIAQNQLLDHDTSEKIKVRVEFKKDIEISDLPSSGDTSIVFKFKGDYRQADENAVPRPSLFEIGSWSDIVNAYNNDPTQFQKSMKAGATREVQLDLDNDGTAEKTGHLRIANLSTPEECLTQGFSQSACGFVVEFADTIVKHRANPYIENDTTTIGVNAKGGWEYSDIRAYLNSTTYAYENIDYSTSGIFNSLPTDLRSKIIDTTVVSGHNNNDSTNFTTIDKLYLLSTKEVWGSNPLSYDSAADLTRQLDYYHEKGVTTSNYSGAIKKNNGIDSYWWLRSTNNHDYNSFVKVDHIGNWGNTIINFVTGVSPAFRIA